MGKNSKLRFVMGILSFPMLLSIIFSLCSAPWFRGIIIGLIYGFSLDAFFIILSKIVAKYNKGKKEGFANDSTNILFCESIHYIGLKQINGWLFLKNDELTFNTRSSQEEFGISIPIETISVVRKINQWFFIPYAIEIKTKDGGKEKFIVDNRDVWSDKINELIHPVV